MIGRWKEAIDGGDVLRLQVPSDGAGIFPNVIEVAALRNSKDVRMTCQKIQGYLSRRAAVAFSDFGKYASTWTTG